MRRPNHWRNAKAPQTRHEALLRFRSQLARAGVTKDDGELARHTNGRDELVPGARSMNVDEVMTRSCRTITADTSVGEAWHLLQFLKVSHLPVTNEDGGLVGLVSEEDCWHSSISGVGVEHGGTQGQPSMASVRTVMTQARVVIEADDDIEEAVDLMAENKVMVLPVIDADGAVVGLVRSIDCATVLLQCR